MFAFVFACCVALAVLGWGEWAHWRASYRRLGTTSANTAGREIVVALGFKNRGATANRINRFRVRAALRSVNDTAASSLIIFSGGAVASDVPEAELMAQYARQRGFTGQLVTETASQSTWENIQNVVGLLGDADQIKIVSNGLHAEKARAFLAQQRPEIARRLVKANEYRFGELIFDKPILAAAGLRNLRAAQLVKHAGGLPQPHRSGQGQLN